MTELTGIKICGLMSVQDAEYVNEFDVAFAGVVMFFPKSRRNVEPEKAREIVCALRAGIIPVAVMVEPSAEQIAEAVRCGFRYVQLHGSVDPRLIESAPVPVFKAFNVKDMDMYEKYSACKNIAGYVFDAAEPGSGKTFDWSELRSLPRDGRLVILAGGLTAENAAAAVGYLNPDAVDVSSGVENEDKTGKSKERIQAFVNSVRSADK